MTTKPSRETLNAFVGPVNPPAQFGRENRLKSIQASPTGSTTIEGVVHTTWRVDCYVTNWGSSEALYQSTVIEPSFFIAFDEVSNNIVDLTIRPKENPSTFQASL